MPTQDERDAALLASLGIIGEEFKRVAAEYITTLRVLSRAAQVQLNETDIRIVDGQLQLPTDRLLLTSRNIVEVSQITAEEKYRRDIIEKIINAVISTRGEIIAWSKCVYLVFSKDDTFDAQGYERRVANDLGAPNGYLKQWFLVQYELYEGIHDAKQTTDQDIQQRYQKLELSDAEKWKRLEAMHKIATQKRQVRENSKDNLLTPSDRIGNIALTLISFWLQQDDTSYATLMRAVEICVGDLNSYMPEFEYDGQLYTQRKWSGDLRGGERNFTRISLRHALTMVVQFKEGESSSASLKKQYEQLELQQHAVWEKYSTIMTTLQIEPQQK